MPRDVVDPLDQQLRALRTLQLPNHVQFDPEIDDFVVSSAAFKMQSDGTISVDLEEILSQDNLPLVHCYPRVNKAVGLVAHTVGRLVADGHEVKHQPVVGNDYHGYAKGKLSKTKRVALANSCEIIVELDKTQARQWHEESERLKAAALD